MTVDASFFHRMNGDFMEVDCYVIKMSVIFKKTYNSIAHAPNTMHLKLNYKFKNSIPRWGR